MSIFEEITVMLLYFTGYAPALIGTLGVALAEVLTFANGSYMGAKKKQQKNDRSPPSVTHGIIRSGRGGVGDIGGQHPPSPSSRFPIAYHAEADYVSITLPVYDCTQSIVGPRPLLLSTMTAKMVRRRQYKTIGTIGLTHQFVKKKKKYALPAD